MLRYNIENLAPDHLATIIGVLDADADGQQIAAVWIAKEHLRDLLALRATRTHVTPAPSAVRDKLASFYIWCADNDSVPEIKTLAKTISKWQQPVIDAVLTGYSNAKAEAHNRTAKLVARNARGFANPHNQARRVRMATTRTARHARTEAGRRRSRKVTEEGRRPGRRRRTPAGSGWAGNEGGIGGAPVKFGDPRNTLPGMTTGAPMGSPAASLFRSLWPSWRDSTCKNPGSCDVKKLRCRRSTGRPAHLPDRVPCASRF